MTSIPPYLSESYSEDLYPYSEADFSEVMRAPAVEVEWPAYTDWSLELEEQSQWKGSKQIHGILIKKACEHRDCPHERCEKEVRIGGIAI